MHVCISITFLSRRRRRTRLTRSGLVDTPQALRRSGRMAGTGTSHQARPEVKAQVQAGMVSGPLRVGLRVGLATANLNERATGRNPLGEPGGSRMGEGQVHTSGPDQGRPKLSDGRVKRRAKSAWDRITAPSLARCGCALGWAKAGLGAYPPGRCRREDGRRTDASTRHAIKHGIIHSPDPGQARVQGSGLRPGPAGGPGSTRSI